MSHKSLTRLFLAVATALALGRPATVAAGQRPSIGSWVDVSIEVDGVSAPLYPAPDASGRLYVEARRGARYALHLANRTGERLAVAVAVDGLDVISGELRTPSAARRPRMYVLDPWESTAIQGWRTSLQDVHLFTFVDEEHSYATRAGKANGKMGWIEVAVYREQRAISVWPLRDRPQVRGDQAPQEERQEASRATPAPPAAGAPSADANAQAKAAPETAGGRAYPGTGWGPRADDPVRVVDFQPQPAPVETMTVRYEYAPALRALGLLPRPAHRDRLAERERGEYGFAQPPAWD